MKREEPRKRRRGKIIDCDDYRDSGWPSSARYPWERMSDAARAFLDGDDLIDGHIGQFVYLPAGPRDHERFDFGSLAQAKMNPRIAGRHIARSTLRLFHLRKPFRGEFQRGAGAVPVGFCPDQQTLEPVIGIPAVIAQEFRIIAAVVDGNIEVTVVVEIRGSQTTSRNRAKVVRTELRGSHFEMSP